jgi:hypothetical protein
MARAGAELESKSDARDRAGSPKRSGRRTAGPTRRPIPADQPGNGDETRAGARDADAGPSGRRARGAFAATALTRGDRARYMAGSSA